MMMTLTSDHPQVLQHQLSHHLPAVCQCDVRQEDTELHLRGALERQTGEQRTGERAAEDVPDLNPVQFMSLFGHALFNYNPPKPGRKVW